MFHRIPRKGYGSPQENTLPFLPSPSHPLYGFSCRVRTSPPIQSHMCSMFIGTGFRLDLPFQIPPYEEHLRSSLTIPSARLVGNFHPREINSSNRLVRGFYRALGSGVYIGHTKGNEGSPSIKVFSKIYDLLGLYLIFIRLRFDELHTWHSQKVILQCIGDLHHRCHGIQDLLLQLI